MGLFQRTKPLSKRIEQAKLRVKRLATHDLYEWAEQCTYAYGKCIADHRMTEGKTAANMLEEAILAAEVARVIAEELQVRALR